MPRCAANNMRLPGLRWCPAPTVAHLFGLLLGTFFFLVMPATAEWRVDVESKTVDSGQTGVTVDFTVFWDANLAGLTIPLVVREIDPGSFWTGPLPYDTGSTAGNHPHVQGVIWNWDVPWAYLAEEVKPIAGLPPGYRCVSAAGDEYEGISPDHFAINAVGSGIPSADAEPEGRAIVTISFAVTEQPGRFEIDTSCFTTVLRTITLIDDQFPPVDHGPDGADEVIFNKSVITIASPGGILAADDAIPADFVLAQNYPNPFNAGTQIEFSLPEPGFACLAVYDILGRAITVLVDGPMAAGRQQVQWRGKNDRGESVGSGIYFYRLIAGGHSQMRKMLLLK